MSNKKGAIIITDDEPHVVTTLETLLTKNFGEDYEIIGSGSGAETLELTDELLRAEKPIALYLTDIRMPVMNGVEVLSRVRTISPGSIRFVLTGYADQSNAIQAINEAAVHQYLTKPWDDDKLVALLRKHLDAEKVSEVFYKKAETAREKEDAFKLASMIYCEEHMGVRWDDGKHLFVPSEYNEASVVYVALDGSRVVATSSVNFIDAELARKFGTKLGLPFEEVYDAKEIADMNLNLAQISRAACCREYRQFGIMENVWKNIAGDTTDAGVSDYLIIAASSLNDPRQAMQVREMLRRKGDIEPRFDLPLKVPDPNFDALRGQNVEPIERGPKLLFRYGMIGFRNCGDPAYLSLYKMFDFPMTLEVQRMNEPFKSFLLGGKG